MCTTQCNITAQLSACGSTIPRVGVLLYANGKKGSCEVYNIIILEGKYYTIFRYGLNYGLNLFAHIEQTELNEYVGLIQRNVIHFWANHFVRSAIAQCFAEKTWRM